MKLSPRSAYLLALILIFLFAGFSAAQVQESLPARKIVRQLAPVYPALARNTHTYGAVKLKVTVDRNGAPKSINVVGGNPVLVKAAEESVGKWKWVTASSETVEHVELRFQPN